MCPARLAILQMLPGLNIRIWLSSSLVLADGRENSGASLKPPTLPDLRLSNHQAAAVVYPIRLRRFDLSSKRALSGSLGFHPRAISPKSLTVFLSSLRFFTRIHSHHPESIETGFQPAMNS